MYPNSDFYVDKCYALTISMQLKQDFLILYVKTKLNVYSLISGR